MSKKETIYAFRKSDSGYRIENVNKFINAFRQAYPCVNINRQDVEIALKDRPDVRGFRGAYQAPHPGCSLNFVKTGENVTQTRLSITG
jgi:hypothetical protein